MSVYAVGMCKNEIDIAEPVLRHLATQVDHIIAADNGSTDGTRELLDHLATELPMTVIDDPDPAYRQSEKMTALAHQAAAAGADWVVPHDYDEIWYSPFGRIADVLGSLDVTVAVADLFDHVPTGLDNPAITDPIQRIGWRRREPGAMSKMACRTGAGLVIGQGNHTASYAAEPTAITGQLVVRHFPYRTREQFVAKAKQGAAALKLTRLPLSSGAHWRQYGRIAERDGDDALADVFTTWFFAPDPTADPTLMFDPAPV